MLHICYDNAIPLVPALFAENCRLSPLKTNQINSENLQNADALLVRSVTQVNHYLLQHNRRIKFIGSLTSGTDHIDTNYLAERQIKFSYAPGSNAESVANYVLSAIMLCYAENFALYSPGEFTLGIIGYGHIGQLVYNYASNLGLKLIVCDPFKQKETAKDLTGNSQIPFVSLEEALQAANIISLHVPLTSAEQSAFPTFHLLNQRNLTQLKPDALLINTSRGAIIDNQALVDRRTKGLKLVLDVWENEPVIYIPLLNHALVATPHIAGHSIHGKTNGMHKIYEDMVDYFGLEKDKPKIRRQEKSIYQSIYQYSFSSMHNSLKDADAGNPYNVFAKLVDKHLCRLSLESELLKKYPQSFRSLRAHYGLRHDFSKIRFFAVDTELKAIAKQIGLVVD